MTPNLKLQEAIDDISNNRGANNYAKWKRGSLDIVIQAAQSIACKYKLEDKCSAPWNYKGELMMPNNKIVEAIELTDKVMRKLEGNSEEIFAIRNLILLAQSYVSGELKTYKEWTMLEEGDDCVMYCAHVKELQEEDEDCPRCNGKRYIKPPLCVTHNPCPTCKGTGKLPKPLSMEECKCEDKNTDYHLKVCCKPKPSGETKQMTVQEIETLLTYYGIAGRPEIATALFEAVYGGRKK